MTGSTGSNGNPKTFALAGAKSERPVAPLGGFRRCCAASAGSPRKQRRDVRQGQMKNPACLQPRKETRAHAGWEVYANEVSFTVAMPTFNKRWLGYVFTVGFVPV